MGLHVTPYGTFYVQRSLRTGEVMQVLPVKRPEQPSHLPSVDSLGITENFIEHRRASLAADTARAEDSQGRLQQELATAGGESLLATGKAVLAQNGGSDSNTHNSPSAPNCDGDVEMAYGSSTAGSASGPPTSPASYQHSSATRQSRSNSYRGSNMNYILSEDPHQQSSSMAMAPQMLPVRSWPDALHQEATVNLPPFREIDSARALTHEEELRHEEQISNRGGGSGHSSSSRRRSTASPRMTSLLRSSSRNSSRSNSTSSMSHGHGHGHGHGLAHGHGHGHNNASISSSISNAFSISNMISHGSEGSVSSAYSASEVSTPSAPFSPGPDYYYCNSNNGYSPATSYAAMSPAASFGGGNNGCSMMVDGAPAPLAPSPLATPAPQKKNKTVWIIRTLEPRKTSSRRMANGGEDYDDYEPQRVQTHVETHIAP
ncbi:hypothetical protein Sste5344_010384 [Sporothrix stenoceras]